MNKDTVSSGAYYISGDDLYWVDKAVEVFCGMSADPMSRKVFDGGMTDFGAVEDAVFLCNFSGEPNVVIVRDTFYKPDAKAHEQLKHLLKSDLSPSFLVFVNVPYLDNEEKKLLKTITCAKMKTADLVRYVNEAFGDKIERNAVPTLVGYTCGDTARLNTELTKLLDYTEGRKVTVKDVEDLVCEDAEYQVYDFVNSVVAGRTAQALKQLAKLTEKGTPYAMMLSALTTQFRRLLHCALSPLDNKALADIFKVKEFAIIKARETVGFTKKMLKSTVDMLVGYELQFKSGVMGEETAFKCAVARLLAKEVQ